MLTDLGRVLLPVLDDALGEAIELLTSFHGFVKVWRQVVLTDESTGWPSVTGPAADPSLARARW